MVRGYKEYMYVVSRSRIPVEIVKSFVKLIYLRYERNLERNKEQLSPHFFRGAFLIAKTSKCSNKCTDTDRPSIMKWLLRALNN